MGFFLSLVVFLGLSWYNASFSPHSFIFLFSTFLYWSLPGFSHHCRHWVTDVVSDMAIIGKEVSSSPLVFISLPSLNSVLSLGMKEKAKPFSSNRSELACVRKKDNKKKKKNTVPFHLTNSYPLRIQQIVTVHMCQVSASRARLSSSSTMIFSILVLGFFHLSHT